MRKTISGYMTVEATFIMPITLGIYLLVILAMMSLYDRILVDQNLARATVVAEGAMLKNDYRQNLDLMDAKDRFQEKDFIDMKMGSLEYRIQGDLLKVSATGEDYKKEYEVWVLNPVSLLRLEKKIEDIKEEKEEGI